jgi:hypothetical protein
LKPFWPPFSAAAAAVAAELREHRDLVGEVHRRCVLNCSTVIEIATLPPASVAVIAVGKRNHKACAVDGTILREPS